MYLATAISFPGGFEVLIRIMSESQPCASSASFPRSGCEDGACARAFPPAKIRQAKASMIVDKRRNIKRSSWRPVIRSGARDLIRARRNARLQTSYHARAARKPRKQTGVPRSKTAFEHPRASWQHQTGMVSTVPGFLQIAVQNCRIRQQVLIPRGLLIHANQILSRVSLWDADIHADDSGCRDACLGAVKGSVKGPAKGPAQAKGPTTGTATVGGAGSFHFRHCSFG